MTVDPAAANRAERVALVELFASLDDDQLAVPSLCRAWDVGDVLAHLASPLALSKGEQARIFARTRSFDALTIGMVRATRALPVERQLDALARSADRPFVPPIGGMRAPLTDAVVHGEDVRVPLGLPRALPDATLCAVLDFGTSWSASPVFVPFRRLGGLAFAATDLEWTAGPASGPRIEGPARQLALAIFGRADAAPDLVGDGLAVLAARAG